MLSYFSGQTSSHDLSGVPSFFLSRCIHYTIHIILLNDFSHFITYRASLASRLIKLFRLNRDIQLNFIQNSAHQLEQRPAIVVRFFIKTLQYHLFLIIERISIILRQKIDEIVFMCQMANIYFILNDFDQSEINYSGF